MLYIPDIEDWCDSAMEESVGVDPPSMFRLLRERVSRPPGSDVPPPGPYNCMPPPTGPELLPPPLLGPRPNAAAMGEMQPDAPASAPLDPENRADSSGDEDDGPPPRALLNEAAEERGGFGPPLPSTLGSASYHIPARPLTR